MTAIFGDLNHTIYNLITWENRRLYMNLYHSNTCQTWIAHTLYEDAGLSEAHQQAQLLQRSRAVLRVINI